ncbi:50S ribosomal protein L24 [Spiroplasma taiwanense]|uniref:Large ribosomal subunit protein uL24 n=1 Tax=Spiroplasma taiwanense CT-1 TaxID=1276220 RepID=S5MD14_9MOLU|nr:50S ribosomal protein L24 [Spiroplasma taiwanense]AGR41603.1 50S ribosomal protein L24 [Spiroplasma taiwanense CT-1]
MNKSKILRGDVVKVISGNHKGKTGPITKLTKDKKRVYIEGITGIKHVKPSQTDQEGGIKEIAISIDISNVALKDPKNKDKTTRVGYKITDGKKVRIAKKSGAEIK